MIVTLTLNPCIDLNLEIDDFAFDTPLRANAERKRAGGKGVNVNQCLEVLEVESIAVVPLGGPGGMEFRELVERQFGSGKAKLVAAEIGGNTRTNVVVSSTRTGRQLKVNEQGPDLDQADVMRVLAALDGWVGYGDVIALCGSLPSGVDPALYADLVTRYIGRGAFVALDASGEAFTRGIEAKPHAVKPNREELAVWAGGSLDDPAAFEDAARRLATETSGLCLATDGSRSALLATPDRLFRIEPAPASGSPVGAGDASLAGLLAGLVRQGEPHRATKDEAGLTEAFHLAAACGSAAASTADTVMFGRDELRRFVAATPRPETIWSK